MSPQRSLPGSTAHPLMRLWRALGHPALLLGLCSLAALLFAAHLWLPQLPTPLAADELGRGAWLRETAAALPAGGILAALGLLDLAHGAAPRVLLPLLAAALLVRIGDRMHLAWATRRPGRPDRDLPNTVAFDYQEAASPATERWSHHNQRLFHRMQARDGDQLTPAGWWADRNQPFTWAGALLELGLLLGLLALLLNLRTGWQLPALTLDPGQTASLQPFSANTVALSPGAETLTLCCAPEQTAPLAGRGIHANGLRVTVQQLSPALRVSARAGNQPLTLLAVEQSDQPAPQLLLRFPQARSERAVAIPDRNLFLRIASAGDEGFRIQALDASGAIMLSQELGAAATLDVAGVALRLEPTRSATVSVQRRPWLWLLAPALLLALAGLFVRWRFPYARLGVLYNEAGLAVRWQGQPGARPSLAEARELLDHAQ